MTDQTIIKFIANESKLTFRIAQLMHRDHYGAILPNHKFVLKWQPAISILKFIQSSSV